LNTDEVQFFW